MSEGAVERVPEAPAPRTTYEPVEPTREMARKNVVLGLALFGLFVLIFAATFVIGFIYLHFD